MRFIYFLDLPGLLPSQFAGVTKGLFKERMRQSRIRPLRQNDEEVSQMDPSTRLTVLPRKWKSQER